jgi:hypothetical protein
MTNGKRNRSAGNGWERELAEIFRKLGFPHIVTTRSESRSRDAQKIDLMNKDERTNGRFPYNVQAKNVTGHLKYGKVMAEMATTPNVINVILHKQTEKVGSRFIVKDRFAILRMDDFIDIVKKLKEYEEMITSAADLGLLEDEENDYDEGDIGGGVV